MRFCLWMRTYLGHLTKRVISRFGWMSFPIRKFFGLCTNNGFLALLLFFAADSVVVTTFFPFASFFGYNA